MQKVEPIEFVLDAAYTSYSEVRTTAKRGSGKFLKFFLIDDKGNQVLAATAEDQGDAHYLYKNAKGFNQYGMLDSHNRKEVIMWLEKIIRESKNENFSKEKKEEVKRLFTEDHPEGLYFISQRQERMQCPDGRKANKFYLSDQHNVEHLAVVGEESHARDGHYHYMALEPFCAAVPLDCRNVMGVYHWLEQWLAHNALTVEEEKHGSLVNPMEEDARGRVRSVVLEMGDWVGAGKIRPPKILDLSRLTFSGTRRRLTGAAEGSHEKKLKLMQTEEIAAQEEHHMSWLLDRRMAAVMDAERKRAAALKSLAWLKEQPSEEELGTVEYWHGALREMVATWEAQADGEEPKTKGMDVNIAPNPSKPNEDPQDSCHPHSRSHQWLRLCLEALREVGSMYMPLRLMAESGVLKTVIKLEKHPNNSIARYAAYVTLQWRTQMMAHSRVLLDPEILTDPVRDLEEKIQSGEVAPPPPEMLSPMQKRRYVGNISSDFCTLRSDTNRGGGEAGRQDASGADTETQSATAAKSRDGCSHVEVGPQQHQDTTGGPCEAASPCSSDPAKGTTVEHTIEGDETQTNNAGIKLEAQYLAEAALVATASNTDITEKLLDRGEKDVCGGSVDEGLSPKAEVQSEYAAEASTGREDGKSAEMLSPAKEEDKSKGLFRDRKASKEIPGKGKAAEVSNVDEGEESDSGLILADIPEDFSEPGTNVTNDVSMQDALADRPHEERTE